MGMLERIYRGIPLLRELFQIRDSLRYEVGSLRGLLRAKWDVELQAHPRYGDPRRLLRYSFQVNSQGGEDGIIHEIFRRIGATNRVFVEIGTQDGLESNTAFLTAKGWTGAWIDSDPAFLRTIDERRLGARGVKGRQAKVTRENVAGLLESLGISKEFDLLSIDIDQNTYYAWEGLRGYRARVVVIEYNAALPADLDWKVAYDADRTWDGTTNFGASLKALELLGRDLGYSLVGCDLAGTNAFFVRSDLTADHFAAPFTSENHYEPIRYAYLQRTGQRPGILDPGPRA